MTDEELLKAINGAINGAKDVMIEHINGVGGQLHTQIQEVDTRLAERFDRMEARMDRQGGLLQGGSRAITRMIEWTESADSTFGRYDRRRAALEKRLDDIEKPGKNGR